MYGVILAGGSGTRLWPLSRELYPKYLLQVGSPQKGSLFEQTVSRLNTLIPEENIIVITHENQKSDLQTVLTRKNLSQVTVLGEPEAKNTAAAIALAAWYLRSKDPDSIMTVLPSDHFVEPEEKFKELLEKSRDSAENYGLVTFGIRPDSPETGYGYIYCGEKLNNWTNKVDKFIEKPDLETARKFIQDNRYLWNSGMFTFKIPALIEEFHRHLPQMAETMDKADFNNFSNIGEVYHQLESISIDYGIMEKATGVAVIPADIKWSDVGSWESYYQMCPHDQDNNYLQGNVVDIGSSNSLIISTSRLIGTVGLENLAIVETADALLICPREKAQEVKKITEKLKEKEAEEASTHRTVYRPWGSFTNLTEGKNYKVKVIEVLPGQRLSLQRHKYRAENWTVARGKACITLDDNIYNLEAGQNIQIPVGSFHRLENKGEDIVQVIEVQNGTYLGEDDIERISDDYDRVDAKKNENDKTDDNSETEDYLQKYYQWLNHPHLDEETKEELRAIAEDEEEIKKRFSGELEFGTGGLRGIIAAGTNRMNRFVVQRATQGLANYLSDTFSTELHKGVVIAYDSRRYSREFAESTALVLAANGITAYLFENMHPTPVLSFAIRKLGCLAGVVITASHNPPQYNGYKVYTRDGGQAVPEVTDKLTDYINNVEIINDVKFINKEEAIKKELLQNIGEEIDRDYLDNVKSLCDYKGKKDLKVVYTPLHGTGSPLIPRLLKELEYENVFLVNEQSEPDSEFPTVKTPNPEEREALSMAIEHAQRKNAHIALATDPDGDRVGCAVQDINGNYILLNGNQIGALLVNYLLSKLQANGNLSSNGVVIKTIVTGNMGKAIAESYGVETQETLTGFKFIGEKIEEFQKENKKQFLFGYEESFGYLAGTFVRDKDALIATALIVEMAAYYHEQNLTLLDVLEDLYQNFGYYNEELESIELTESSSAEKIIENLATQNIKQIGGIEIAEKRNYISGIAVNPHTLEERKMDFPQTSAIFFELKDNSWFCVRPSGTEPKFKIYYSTIGQTHKEAQEKMESLKKEVQGLLQT